jgi:hypothetical protein
MIQNKKGLSDIVTTALIILLVAVAVAAIWAFVSPALRGTGTQFTKTQVCVSNIIEPITCKTTAGGTGGSGVYPITVQVRRTLTDGVAVPTEFNTVMGTTGGTPESIKMLTDDKTGTTVLSPSSALASDIGTVKAKDVKIPKTQGELIEIKGDYPAGTQSAGSSPQAQVTTTYKLPDNTIVKCPSLPITCSVA